MPQTTIERKPGETFEYSPGIILEVQPSCTCKGCYFACAIAGTPSRCRNRNIEITGYCGATQRTDHHSQIFRHMQS